MTEPDVRHATGGRPLRDVVLLLVLHLGGGAVAGLVWRLLWTPPVGVVQDGVWYTDSTGVQGMFSGTGLYVVVAVVTGLLLGVVSGMLFARQALVTLAVVVLGSALAGWLMLQVGTLGAPPDPQRIAAGAADDTELPGTLTVEGRSPYVAFPAGALSGLCAVFIGVSAKPPVGRREDASGS